MAGAVPETKTMELLCRAKAAQSTDQALSKQDAGNWAAALLDVEIRSKETFPYLFYLMPYYVIIQDHTPYKPWKLESSSWDVLDSVAEQRFSFAFRHVFVMLSIFCPPCELLPPSEALWSTLHMFIVHSQASYVFQSKIQGKLFQPHPTWL